MPTDMEKLESVIGKPGVKPLEEYPVHLSTFVSGLKLHGAEPMEDTDDSREAVDLLNRYSTWCVGRRAYADGLRVRLGMKELLDKHGVTSQYLGPECDKASRECSSSSLQLGDVLHDSFEPGVKRNTYPWSQLDLVVEGMIDNLCSGISSIVIDRELLFTRLRYYIDWCTQKRIDLNREELVEKIKASLRVHDVHMHLEDVNEATAVVRAEDEDEYDYYKLLQRPVSDLYLSVRSRKCCVRIGAQTVLDLASLSGGELTQIKNFGVTSLNEVRGKLEDLGLGLRGD